MVKASVVVLSPEDGANDELANIIKELNAWCADLREKNPKGFIDQMESQLDSKMLDIGRKLGLTVTQSAESRYIFHHPHLHLTDDAAVRLDNEREEAKKARDAGVSYGGNG